MKTKKVFFLIALIATLASCSTKHTLKHSHYTNTQRHGADGCGWHKN